MTLTRGLSVLLGLVFCTFVAWGAEPSFILTGTNGETQRGLVRSLSDNGEVSLGEAKVKGDAWVSLRRAGQRLPVEPDGPQLILTNGDRFPLAFDKLALSDEKVTLVHPLLGDGKGVSISLAAVVVLWVHPLDDGGEPARVRRQLTTAKRTRDVLALRNGDLLEGVLTSIQKGDVEIEVARKKVTVPLSKLSSVAMSSELALPLKLKGAHARLILDDGSRWTLTEVRSDGKEFSGKTAFGAAFKVALSKVAALEARHENIVYLSDLKAKSYEHTPYLSLKWPLVNDANVEGGDLRLPDGSHDKGVGMHSAGRVTYIVPPGWERFEALVGLDERTGKLGSVQVRVEVDGKSHALLDGKELTPQRGAVPVKINVKGAKELTLIVEFGRGGDVGDHVNWADARFVK